MSWKTKDGQTTADHLQPQMEVMFHGMLNKQTLLDLIRQFVVFEKVIPKHSKSSRLPPILCRKQSRRKYRSS